MRPAARARGRAAVTGRRGGVEELPRGGASGGVLGEAGGQERRQRRVRRREFGHDLGLGFLERDTMHHADARSVPEGGVAGGGVDQAPREREDVGGGVAAPLAQILGRHEGGRADPAPGRGDRAAVGGLRDAEVDDVRALQGQDHVGRLEIPVYDAHGGHRRQSLPKVRHQPPHAGRRQCAAVAHGVGEVEAGYVLRGHPQQRVVEAGAEQLRRTRGVDPGMHGGLPLETPPEPGVFGVLGADHLDGGETGGVVGGAGEVDAAHAAAAE